jgi:hypothetical protein
MCIPPGKILGTPLLVDIPFRAVRYGTCLSLVVPAFRVRPFLSAGSLSLEASFSGPLLPTITGLVGSLSDTFCAVVEFLAAVLATVALVTLVLTFIAATAAHMPVVPVTMAPLRVAPKRGVSRSSPREGRPCLSSPFSLGYSPYS